MAKLLKVGSFDVLESVESLEWVDAVKWQEKVNSEVVGGFSDWVLPDLHTLKALYLVSDSNPTWFWSSSPSEFSSECSWAMLYIDGDVKAFLQSEYFRVRLVRAGQMLAIGQAGQLESMRLAGIPLPGVNS